MVVRPLRALIGASVFASLTACAVPAPTAQQSTAPATEPVVYESQAAPTTTPPTTAKPVDPLTGGLVSLWASAPNGCLMVTEGAKVLWERNPDATVTPASTMKLLTAAAVLAKFEPTERLRTPVLATAAPVGGVVAGDLVLMGGGDPTLGTLPWGARFTRQPQLVTALEVLADRVAAAGIREVTGRVVGDDGRHERVRYLPTWPGRYRNEVGPLSALAVNDGADGWGPGARPFVDPAAGAASVFNELLRQRGVRVHGLPGSGALRPGSVEVAAMDSPTMAELVGQMLRESDNLTAELLVRELGLRVHGKGTSAAGALAVHQTLRDLGLPMQGVNILDGSGLDPANRITCRLLTAILQRGDADVERGLPIAAQTGTLYKRFLATPVAGHLRAKTGSIRRVAALAGHVDAASGRRLTFAYVLNGSGFNGRSLQDLLGHHLFGS